MQSATGRFVIVFNGEVYNIVDLRRDLERWGVSDASLVSWASTWR